MHKIQALILFLSLNLMVTAQENFPVNGVANPKHTSYLFQNATIQVSPTEQLQQADLRIKDGKILAVGQLTPLGGDEILVPLDGKYIYAGFIDLDSDYGLEKPPKKKRSPRPQYETNIKGAYGWNEAIKPEVHAANNFQINIKEAEQLRKMGFTTVLTHHHDGIARGTGALVNLRTDIVQKAVSETEASAHFSFSKGTSKQQYPSSLMGVIAILRQTHYDAEWYRNTSELDHTNLSLNAWNEAIELPWVLEVKEALDIPRAQLLAQEMNHPFIIRANNDAYQVASQLENARLIIPLTTPKALDVSDPLDAMYATLAQMKHWELAPANARLLNESNIAFAFTAKGNNKPEAFFKQLQRSVVNGLPQEKVLQALTTEPASWLGLTDVGKLKPGYQSNFFITDKPIFDKRVQVLASNIQDTYQQYKHFHELHVGGTYNLNVEGTIYTLKLKGKKNQLTGSILMSGDTLTVHGEYDHEQLSFYHTLTTGEMYRYTGKSNFKGKILDGRLQTSQGDWKVWSAILQGEVGEQQARINDTIETKALPLPWYPNKAFGYDTLPVAKDYFIDQVTVWSCDSNGKFIGDVVVREGKIAEVGKSLAQTPDLIYVNGKGMHLTPGIVDEHSHIAISRGVNEGTQASSAEVRIGDVVNPNDVNIYRQLSGGVTTVQLLHGSANPIGGQSALIKLKWGTSAESMKIDDAPGFIKFALGENVKQSNWGDNQKSRFPQTRMGVEQVYYDYFIRAKAYAKEQSPQEQKGILSIFKCEEPINARRDLELEAIAEILDTTRFISCHSYVQSEVNMLMHVADSMDFTVNTFTHILEGYKLADKLAEHGAAGSTFADWWAYKFEVNDAIPYNAAIMNEQGVLTGINSDDAEMGRRLNQEAAKTVKYGGVPEEEALKMVTLNPAKMLHLDHRIGSITAGKDADLVLWSSHPLSVYSKVELTMIEGVVYFSQKQHQEALARMNKERDRLIQKMLKAKSNGASTTKVNVKHPKLYHCDTEEDEGH